MIKSIQYLRFLAAILVVYGHSNLQIYGVAPHTTNLGGFGVDIFFVISGFIMPYIIFGGLLKEGTATTMSAGSFMWRRVTRIWPMYAVTIMAVVACCFVVGKGLVADPTVDLAYFYNVYRAEPSWIFETLTFTHGSRPPILTIGWTLQMEFVFYAAITAALLFRARSLEGIESGVVVILFGALLLSSKSVVAATFASPIIFEFFLGVFLYRLASRGVLMNKSIAMFVALLSIPLFLTIDLLGLVPLPSAYTRPISWGFPAFLLVWSMLRLEGCLPRSSVLLLLGDAPTAFT
ncbi:MULTISPECIES: acyltransferase family protein [Pseudomonas]|uniref:Acyltransferase n=1 Tax=Pseudomonas quercus TaxID=2722792 RepID=A0ABX0YNH8_9PSED|nr:MULTISPECIES: acyltransferase [Pseudomonas]MBF7144936.1 acyltransferase [Pseudomonas sp. LY10J]NJP03528.1 acyltransferase [Pseudomonas quercus]